MAKSDRERRRAGCADRRGRFPGGLAALTFIAALGLAPNAQANGQHARSVLPVPPAPFDGKIAESVAQSTPGTSSPVRAPQGAPNVFLFMSDDVGFATTSVFGGVVPTPNMDRLAAAGQRYNRFHTTGICSPSRAALLTGRNHHNAGTGYLVDNSTEYPGYSGRIPASTVTLAQTLRLNGYNTAMFGKHHNVPAGEDTAAGPFDMWPTGLGFEYFFGFVSADSDQWNTNLFRGNARVPPSDEPARLLDQRLADDAITWIHNQDAAAPDKPFFIYYAPASVHAPHQAPPEIIARFKGKFDHGWDKVREETYRRQVAMGAIPRRTKLTPRPAEIPAWASLSPIQQRYAARAMEVAAAMVAYQDEQLGRVLDELQRMGELEKTLVVLIQGDNGASADNGIRGTVNELSYINRALEDDAWLDSNVDRLGGQHTYPNYPAGWAWAMNTPLRWVKQYASMLGGVRNGMIISYPGHVSRPNSVCGEFGHLVDIVPTVLEAAKVPAPETVYGVKQKPLNGLSLLPGLSSCDPAKPRTQYFELGGKRGLYHNGWFASLDDGRMAWETVLPSGSEERQKWELYDLASDFSQARDVSAEFPERLTEMVDLWHAEARRNNVFPIDNRFGVGRGLPRSNPAEKVDYWGKDVSLPAIRSPMSPGRSFTLDAHLQLQESASGVIAAMGSHFAGWSLYLDGGRPAFVYAKSTNPAEVVKIAAPEVLPAGSGMVRLTFKTDHPGGAADVSIAGMGKILAKGRIPSTFLVPAGMGETLDFGRDLGVPVTEYRTPRGEIEGDILKVTVTMDK